MDRMGPILTVRLSLCRQCKFDRDGDGHGYGDDEGDGMCKQALTFLEPYFLLIRQNGASKLFSHQSVLLFSDPISQRG